jgi:hypothetical protein
VRRILFFTSTIVLLLLSAHDGRSADVVLPDDAFDLADRRRHWAYQVVVAAAPPAVEDAKWCTSPIDFFILSGLENAGLEPAPPADKRTLIRRLTFDLIGLPPTPDEINAFLEDDSPHAYERLVNRLLESPHYGERWARHWLDVVRYGETHGFEFDFDLYNAWRYRDYVIRAFNSDLPYDQFVMEHLAGDLVPVPRRHPTDGTNESILATGLFWMCEGKQTPVDIREEQANVIENQIDVVGKAFLGQTIACARCHDHKFDAISTRDYYALMGYLRSSRYQQAFIDAPERIGANVAELAVVKSEIWCHVLDEVAPIWRARVAEASRYLLASRFVEPLQPRSDEDDSEDAREVEGNEKEAQNAQRDRRISKIASEMGLDATRLRRWIDALQDDATQAPDHPLFAWSRLVDSDIATSQRFQEEREATRKALVAQDAQAARASSESYVFEDFSDTSLEDWYVTGHAFGDAPVRAGEVVLGKTAKRPIARITRGGADSGMLSNRLEGVLRSATFTIDKPYVHFRVAGRDARVNLVVDGNTLIMNPIYGGLSIKSPGDLLAWHSMAVDRWIGHRAYIEVSDTSVPPHRLNPPPSTARVPENDRDGYFVLDRVLFSDSPVPPATPSRINLAAITTAEADTIKSLAAAYQALMTAELKRWLSSGSADADDAIVDDDGLALLNWLLVNGLLDASEGEADADSLAAILKPYVDIDSTIPLPRRAPALADGTGENEYVFIRGSHRTLGEPAPRRPPEVLASCGVESHQAEAGAGSGRLELARALIDPSNPLLARVMVNRLWQHHFGAGIVRTPDDFGRMGQPPTHPDLLDYLASEFVASGWSIKAMHRLMVNSSTYRQSSEFGVRNSEFDHPQSAISNPQSIDPENRLLSHMPVRRLEAEAIRDAMLAVSGELNRELYGPSVLPYLTPHMEGRGRPSPGPLNGDGRRSIYINARRNFLTPMFVAFDYPAVFTPVGRRSVSTNAAQALTLMNDPFVIDQAARWAERVIDDEGTTEQRIDAMYQFAFGRPATHDELQQAMDFLERQAMRYENSAEGVQAWADLCHVMFNVKEFIFIN